ncbi:MAG TPA: sensor domain-containing protein [Mycobacterium sp.]
MWRLVLFVVATSVVGLTGACATTVGGTPKAEKAASSSAAAPGPSSAAPPAAAPAARTVGAQDLEALLLPADDVRTVMDGPDIDVQETYDQMPPSTVGYDPPECARAAYNVVEAGYRDSGFIAARGAVMQEPDDAQLLHVVDQGIVTFPTADAATDYVTKTVQTWRGCAGKPFTASRPEAAEHWTFGDVTENGGISAIPKTVDGDTGWSCSHAIAAKSNAVIDVSACGFSINDQAKAIVGRIRDKFPA